MSLLQQIFLYYYSHLLQLFSWCYFISCDILLSTRAFHFRQVSGQVPVSFDNFLALIIFYVFTYYLLSAFYYLYKNKEVYVHVCVLFYLHVGFPRNLPVAFQVFLLTLLIRDKPGKLVVSTNLYDTFSQSYIFPLLVGCFDFMSGRMGSLSFHYVSS